MTKKEFGNYGEAVACAYLQQKGFILLAHQYRSGALEIDLVMMEDAELVFVEVKSRKNNAFGLPEESVSYIKQQHLIAAAEAYLFEQNIQNTSCRFDVITLVPKGKSFQIKHLRNAFWGE